MAKDKEKQKLRPRDTLTTIALSRDEQEFSETLTTDVKKLNQNKFFFNMEGDNNPSSQD